MEKPLVKRGPGNRPRYISQCFGGNDFNYIFLSEDMIQLPNGSYDVSQYIDISI